MMTMTETTETNDDRISPEDYEKVKSRLEELSQRYKEQIDVVAVEANVLALIRSQINDCLELVYLYQKHEKEVESDE